MPESLYNFFEQVTGHSPLPYQQRYGADPFHDTILLAQTGLGKTETVIVPWLHATAEQVPRTPRRLILVLPRRNLTEQTANRARGLAAAAGLDKEMVIELMSGSDDNALTLRPNQPAVIVCTQDMYLSRALNRGYARRPPRWPIDFALFNQDCLLVFDEVQLMGDGLATSTQLAAFRRQFGIFGRAPCVWMSATLKAEWLDTIDFRETRTGLRVIRIEDEDRRHELVAKRLGAAKTLERAPDGCRTPKGCAEFVLEKHEPGTRTLIIVNTVPRAREIFAEVRRRFEQSVLLHSRFRPAERKSQLEKLRDIPPQGQIVVSTQVLEAGIDITSLQMITDVAPWGSLVQRFGRVNRYGDDEPAKIWWVDQPLSSKAKVKDPARVFAPYEIEEVQRAADKLKELTSAAPDDLPLEDGPEPWRHVLRRADLLDLFDTSPDVMGNEIDVSRFIRSGEDKDCYVAWREWEGDPNTAQLKETRDEELCPAPIGDLSRFIRRRDVYVWHFPTGKWRRADENRLYPGMVLLVRTADGGYTEEAGWNPDSQTAVPPVRSGENDPDAHESDFLSGRKRQGLGAHTNRVRAEMTALLGLLDLGLEDFRADLELAAAKHDWGKAHGIMQRTLYAGEPPNGELLAKSQSMGKHEVPHFRHELASALAMISAGDSDLAAYLAAAHHGKVRVTIRSMPGEKEQRVRGLSDGDPLPACELATGVTVPAVELSLDPVTFGAGNDGTPSWTDRVIRLRDRFGPFRLAYLEMLLRAADERASERPEEVVA